MGSGAPTSHLYKGHITLQGDTSRWPKPPVDLKTKDPIWPGLAWPGQSGTFVLKSMGGFSQRDR